MRKNVIILVLLFVHVFWGQNTALNHSKYWFYRYRLRNEFLTQGIDNCGKPSGKMIPGSSRYDNKSSFNATVLGANGLPLKNKNGTDSIGIFHNPTIGYGDGTSFVGTYMAVLASEYALLKRNSNTPQYQLDSLKQELYWLMMAYERLDRNAEGGDNVTPNGMPLGTCTDDNNLNGFFLRNDDDSHTPEKMRRPYFERRNGQRLPVVNPSPMLWDIQIAGTNNQGQGLNNESLEHNSCEHKRNLLWGSNACNDDSERRSVGQPYNSTDQMANLLVGFAYIVKLMGNESYKGYVFKDKAKDYCQRMGEYFDGDFARWSGKIPNTDRVAKYMGGAEFLPSSYGLSRALDVIVRERWNGASTLFPTYRFESKMHNLAPTAWLTNGYPTGMLSYKFNYTPTVKNGCGDYNNAVISQPAAVGNSWAEGLVPVAKTLVSFGLPYPCGDISCPCAQKVFGMCVLPKLDQCTWEWCRQEVNVRCYTYQITPNLARIINLGNFVSDQLVDDIFQNVNSVGFPVSKNTITNAALMGLQDIGICLPVLPLPNLTVNTTGLSLSVYGHQTRTELFALEHRLLHNHKQWYGTGNINAYLNTAPCSGPHVKPYFDPHNYPDQNDEYSSSNGIYGWRVDNRFEKSNADYREGKYDRLGCGRPDCDPTQADNYGGNGIDYMLLHNTYYLLHGDDADLANITNEHRRYVSGVTYPVAVSPQGTTASPKVVNGYETLDLDNVTASASATNVKFRAGLNVKLTNTKLAAGSNVKVYTKYEYPCDIDNNRYDDLTYDASASSNLRAGSLDYQARNLPDVVDSATVMQQFQDYLATELPAELNRQKDTLAAVVQKAQTTNFYEPIATFIAKNPPAVASPNIQEGIISMSPNPTTGPLAVTVYSVSPLTGCSIIIYDTFGNTKANFSKNVKGGYDVLDIDVSSLQPGLYTLLFTDNYGFSQTKQFSKQ